LFQLNPHADVEPLDESLASRVQRQRAVVEDLMLKVAERRKRVPEQVKMLLDDALRRQAALADRIEFEQGEDESADISEDASGGRFSFELKMLRCMHIH